MKDGALIGPIIIAIGLVVAAIAFALVGALLQTADGRTELRLDRVEAAQQTLQADLDGTARDLAEMRAEMEKLAEDVALAASAPRAPVPGPATGATPDATMQDGQLIAREIIGEDGPADSPPTEAMTEIMQLADARFNKGITQPRNRVMLEILGHPRSDYGTNCQPVTNPGLRAILETRQTGPIRVTMIRPALDSLDRIFARLRETDPDIYEEVGTAGALCARLVRGSQRSVSNHSWGTAVDLKLEGKLDGFGDGGTQFGLLILAELFNEEGWYWGATYRREDSMHFEVGVETLRKWQAEGLLGPQ